jgi:hypothetical protein
MGHLSKLSMAMRTFITPGQTLDTARQVLVVLGEIWERFRDVEKAAAADRGQGARKKRRTSKSSANSQDVDAAAVTFMLAARIATIVLTSLPLHTTTEAEQAKVKVIVVESLTSFIRQAILAGTEPIISCSGDTSHDVWATQVVAAAALRFRYMVQVSGHTRYCLDDQDDLGELAAAILNVDDCLPEFRAEIVSLMRWDHTRHAHGIESFVTCCTMDLIMRSSGKS